MTARHRITTPKRFRGDAEPTMRCQHKLMQHESVVTGVFGKKGSLKRIARVYNSTAILLQNDLPNTQSPAGFLPSSKISYSEHPDTSHNRNKPFSTMTTGQCLCGALKITIFGEPVAQVTQRYISTTSAQVVLSLQISRRSGLSVVNACCNIRVL